MKNFIFVSLMLFLTSFTNISFPEKTNNTYSYKLTTNSTSLLLEVYKNKHLIHHQNVPGNSNIILQNLTKGEYLLIIYENNKKIRKRFTIKEDI